MIENKAMITRDDLIKVLTVLRNLGVYGYNPPDDKKDVVAPHEAMRLHDLLKNQMKL